MVYLHNIYGRKTAGKIKVKKRKLSINSAFFVQPPKRVS